MSQKHKQIIIILGLVGLIGLGAFGLAKIFSGRAPAGALFRVELPAVYTEPLKIFANGVGISIKPAQAAQAKAQYGFGKDRQVKYLKAYPETDVRQTIYSNKIKEEIILQKPGHPAKFSYEISLENLRYVKDEQGNFNFYALTPENRAEPPNELDKIFIIPAPWMIDADGIKSSGQDAEMEINGNILTIAPDPEWLAGHKYPIILDPSVEISVLNVHSYPLTGENWEVGFTTLGTADLRIEPNDQATVLDDEFVSLTCGGEERQPEILPGDIIFYKDWSCEGIGKVIHHTLRAGDHILKFQFGDEIAYAFNNFSGDHKYAWGENIGWLNASSTHESLTLSQHGLTGYAWGENIGWIKFDYDGAASATNTTATDWGVTHDGNGNLGGYAWGENIGWINFNSAHEQVKVDLNTGDFSGYGWGENIGWINFGHSLTSYVLRYISAPVVSTTAASNVASTIVTANGNVAYTCGAVTERGFKYGLTAADTWSVSETGSFSAGVFKLGIANLTPGTTYHFRAYATNSEGTGYGSYVSFITETEHKGSPIILKENVILKENMIFR
ncbi:fibronectin type III domain-containing protein [Patescibacteria group bacterium]|nr:fibronectin type III domain-containing protein [Patescibacteria group bacterium]